MKKLSLDPKQWKHIKTEGGMTTLRHKDGHELNIAHNSLSPEFQKQLSALSPMVKQAETPLQADEIKHQRLAEGGQAKPKWQQDMAKHHESMKEYEKPATQEKLRKESTELAKEQLSDMDRRFKQQEGHKRNKMAEGGDVNDNDDGSGVIPEAAFTPQDAAKQAPQMSQQQKSSGGGLMSLIPLALMALAEGGEVDEEQSANYVKHHVQPNTPSPEPSDIPVFDADKAKKAAEAYRKSSFKSGADAMGAFAKGGKINEKPREADLASITPRGYGHLSPYRPGSPADIEFKDKQRQTEVAKSQNKKKISDFAKGGEIEFPQEPEHKEEDESPVERHLKNAARVTAESMTKEGPYDPTPMIGGQIEFADGGNVKEEKKKVFGSQSSPSNKEMREKHIHHLKNFTQKLFGLDLQPSGGKINPKTGERRDEDVAVGEDKPDWRSGKLEAQWNPDAIVHELAHLLLLPKGVGLKAGQQLMDKQYADVQKNYGYMQQKRSQGEVQPMAVENMIRRHLGLPSAKQSVPVKEGEGPRMAVDVPDMVIGTRIKKPNGKEVDLIRQSRFLSPENREMVERRMAGVEKFHPERGWLSNLEHMGNKIKAHKEQLPAEELMADGGQVDDGSNIDPTTGKPDYSPRAITNQDLAKRTQQEAQKSGAQDVIDAAKRVYQSMIGKAEGGEVRQHYFEGEQVSPMGEMLPEQQPPESVSTPPRGDLPPIGSVPEKEIPSAENPYKIAYDNQYSMAKRLGQSDEEAQQSAFMFANMQKAADEGRLNRRVKEQQAAHDAAIAQNQQRQQLGMPMLDVPQATIPGTPGAAQTGAVAPPSMNMPPDQGMQQPMAPFDQQAQAQQQQQDDYGMGAYGSMMQKGFQQAEQGIQAQAKAQGELGAQRADIESQQVQNIQQAQDHYINSYNDLMQERQNMIQDVRDGYIDPHKYWDTHSKIASGIGMILAGFNPTSNPNAAVNFLKFQMEQNLNAQRENLGAKQNLLRANLAQFGEARAATEMTRIMQNDIVAHQLEAAAGKAASPLAKAAALQAAGQLRMNVAPAFQQLALRQAIMRISGQGGAGSPGAVDQLLGQLRMFNPEMAKEIESRYIPGVGIAKVPVPQPARDAMTAFTNVDRLMNEALELSQTPGVSMSLSQRARGETLMGELQSAIRTAEDQGVYKQSEAAFMNKMLGKNPAGFLSAIKTVPKIMEMQRLKQNEHRALRQQYGLPAPQFAPPPQPQQIVNIKGQPHTIQTINGQQYYVPVSR